MKLSKIIIFLLIAAFISLGIFVFILYMIEDPLKEIDKIGKVLSIPVLIVAFLRGGHYVCDVTEKTIVAKYLVVVIYMLTFLYVICKVAIPIK